MKPDIFVVFEKAAGLVQEEYVSAVPRVGDRVRLLPSPAQSTSEGFFVKRVTWTPDHTKYDAHVLLEACE